VAIFFIDWTFFLIVATFLLSVGLAAFTTLAFFTIGLRIVLGAAATATGTTAAAATMVGFTVLTVLGIFGFTTFLTFFFGFDTSVFVDLILFGLTIFSFKTFSFLAATLAFLIASFSFTMVVSPILNEPFEPVPFDCLIVPSFNPSAINFFMRLFAMMGSILKLALMYLTKACRDEPLIIIKFYLKLIVQ
jgi:hypothetical protein